MPIGVYGCQVLAEVLNRSLAVESAFRRHYDADESGRRETADDLVRVVSVFLEELEEARTRGLRARIFCRDPIGTVDACSILDQDDLKDLGGELVSAVRASGEM
ncbi:MAG: hypothetical protein ACREL3_07515 [Gemmatimonadales bacterium]